MRTARPATGPYGTTTALIAAALALVPRLGFAAPNPEIVVATPELSGSFATDAEAQVRGALDAGVRRSGAKMLVAQVDTCAQGRCATEVSSVGGTHIVTTHITAENRDYLLEIELYDANGDRIAEVRETCEICGLQEVNDLLTTKVAQLLNGIELDDQGLLTVSSTPAKAQVTIDGEAAGTTPLELPVSPGRHQVRVTKPGYLPVERWVSVSSGVQTNAELDLAPATRRGLQVAGAVSVAAGLLALGGGIALIALDGRQYENRCTGQDVDIDGDCRHVLETRWGGAAAAIVGSLAVGIGATLIVVDRRQRRSTAVRAEVAGSGLRISGRF